MPGVFCVFFEGVLPAHQERALVLLFHSLQLASLVQVSSPLLTLFGTVWLRALAEPG